MYTPSRSNMRLRFSFLFFQFFVITIQQTVNSEQNVTTSVKPFTVNNSTNPNIMERTFTVLNNTMNNDNTDKIKKFDDFRPSIQIGGSLFDDQQPKTIDLPPTDDWSSWNKNSEKSDETSLEAPWRYSKIKFPNDNSYVKAIELNHKHQVIPTQLYPNPTKPAIIPTKPPESMWNKFMSFTGLNNQFPISSPKSFHNDHSDHSSYHGSNHLDTKSFQFNGLDHNSYHGNNLDHNSYHGNNLDHNSYLSNNLDHNSYHGHGLEYPNNGYYIPKEHYHSVGQHGGGISPWKKILKVLATIIPLGLLISALTPTIITVSPSNETISPPDLHYLFGDAFDGDSRESRFNRKHDVPETVMDKIANSLNTLQKLQQDGCEEKVFCELLVNAMFSKNAEEHIKNLLDNFMKGSGLNETSFMKVLEAVKNQNCSPIICRDAKDLT